MNIYILEKINKNIHFKMFIIALFDALISQFYFDSLPFEFKFSLSVAILPVYYYFDKSLNPIKTSIYIATVGLIFRTFTQVHFYKSFYLAFLSDFPFAYFDISYGLLFYFFCYKSEKRSLSNWILIAISADFIGNSIEVLFRYGIGFFFESDSLKIFLGVAIIRGFISLTLVIFFKLYTGFIRKDEHEIRYKQLLILTSELKSEAYFMQKNMDYIEYIMEDAYQLYSDLDDYSDEEVKKIALKIATEIHEVKKNYSRVVEGLGNISDNKIKYNKMKITELVKVLKDTINIYLTNNNLDIQFITSVHTNQYIKNHYLLMSVLRNLVNNSIEELEKNYKHGTIELKFKEEDEYFLFTISDNGDGIEKKDLEYIFEAGFSTKFNEETGNICRGVGLTLVKDIVENQLNGYMEVKSGAELGTEFYVYIGKSSIGG